MTLSKPGDKPSPAARAARKELFSRLREDWDFPSQAAFRSNGAYPSSHSALAVRRKQEQEYGAPANHEAKDGGEELQEGLQWVADMSGLDLEDIKEWRERTFASSDPSSGSNASDVERSRGEEEEENEENEETEPQSSTNATSTTTIMQDPTLAPALISEDTIVMTTAMTTERRRKRDSLLQHMPGHHNDTPPSPKPKAAPEPASPRTLPSPTRTKFYTAKKRRRNRRRKARFDSEMSWNDGLAHWAAQRDAWCCAALVPDENIGDKGPEDASEDTTPQHNHRTPHSDNASTHSLTQASQSSNSVPESGGSSSALDNQTCATPPTPTSVFSGSPPRKDEIVSPPLISSSLWNPNALASPPNTASNLTPGAPQAYPTNLSTSTQPNPTALLPIPPPLLPHHHPSATPSTSRFQIQPHPRPHPATSTPAITPPLYPTIYRKLVLQSLRPAVPINLQHMVNALVGGWIDDGEWPAGGSAHDEGKTGGAGPGKKWRIPPAETENGKGATITAATTSTATPRDKERPEDMLKRETIGATKPARKKPMLGIVSNPPPNLLEPSGAPKQAPTSPTTAANTAAATAKRLLRGGLFAHHQQQPHSADQNTPHTINNTTSPHHRRGSSDPTSLPSTKPGYAGGSSYVFAADPSIKGRDAGGGRAQTKGAPSSGKRHSVIGSCSEDDSSGENDANGGIDGVVVGAAGAGAGAGVGGGGGTLGSKLNKVLSLRPRAGTMG